MSYSIGDGLASISLTGLIVGYMYVKYLGQKKRLEIVHEERMAAMEKGIPLPEFPFEKEKKPGPQERLVIPLLGLVLLTLSVGAMIVIRVSAPATPGFWISPLPFAFLGIGFLVFHFMKLDVER